MRPLPPLALLALLLAACGAPAYYLLPPPAAAARHASPVGTIVVADISRARPTSRRWRSPR